MKPLKIINLICAIFCLSLFFTSSGVSFAASQKKDKSPDIEAAASVDKASIRIGDKITYAITVKAGKDIEVEFPHILPENLAGFAVKDFGSSRRWFFGKNIFKQWYFLDTYVSGEHTIPAIVVRYRAKGQTDWQEVRVNEVTLAVESVLDNSPDRGDIRDIRGPRNFAGKARLYFLVALAALLIIGGAVGFLFLKRKKEACKPPPLPAHIIAYAALEALEKKDYVRKGQTKAYYIELSGIVRHYLEDRFNIRAPQMSTEEFLVKVKDESSLSGEHKGLLRDFLATSDLVKFAKYQPAEAEAGLSMASAKKLIDQTKQEDKPKA